VDAEKISANLHNGVLKVVIPKKEEAKARQISVEVR
jgi:HSP20 family molecular chaperone IbpA